MSFLVIFMIFLGVLALLMLWSYFMCPHVVKTIDYFKDMVQQYRKAMSEERKKDDQDNKDIDLEKWY